MPDAFLILCDLDGVVWLAREPLPGAAEAVARLRSAGHRVVFVTNNSFTPRVEQEHFLLDAGIPAAGDVLSSAMATGTLLAAGMRVFVCGGEGLVEAVTESGAVSISAAEADSRPDGVDAVVVGLTKAFDYEMLRISSTAVRRGARLIASNEDPTYPTPLGPIPGGGAIVASVAAASGARPIVAGKPHAPMADLVRRNVQGFDSRAIMVGDRLSTDGLFARNLGCRFALVRSAVSDEGSEAHIESRGMDVHFRVESLWELTSMLLDDLQN